MKAVAVPEEQTGATDQVTTPSSELETSKSHRSHSVQSQRSHSMQPHRSHSHYSIPDTLSEQATPDSPASSAGGKTEDASTLEDSQMQSSMLDAISQSLYGVEVKEKTIAEIALEALDEGYERIQARFEWKKAFYKFSKDQRWLYLTMETGESVHLDVGGGACFVTENGDNDCRCYLDYSQTHTELLHADC